MEIGEYPSLCRHDVVLNLVLKTPPVNLFALVLKSWSVPAILIWGEGVKAQ